MSFRQQIRLLAFICLMANSADRVFSQEEAPPPAASVLPGPVVCFDFRYNVEEFDNGVKPIELTAEDLPWEIGQFTIANGHPKYFVGRDLLAYTSRKTGPVRIQSRPKLVVPEDYDRKKRDRHNRARESSLAALLTGNVLTIDAVEEKSADLVVVFTGEAQELSFDFATAVPEEGTFELTREPHWVAAIAVAEPGTQPRYLRAVPMQGYGTVHFRIPEASSDVVIKGVHIRAGKRSEVGAGTESILILDNIAIGTLSDQ